LQNSTCEHCSKPLTPQQIKRNGRFCCHACSTKYPWNKGKTGLQVAWNKGLTGIYSEETRKKISDSKKGQKLSEEHKARFNFKGRKHSQESLKKMSKAQKGRIVSEETRAKLKLINIGRKASNETRLKLSKAGKGRKLSKEHIEKTRQFHLGRKRSEETKQKMKDVWDKRTAEERYLHLEPAHKAARLANPSSIEIAIRQVLDSLGIDYLIEQKIGPYWPDILISDRNLVIECDGEYWHSVPGCKEKDAERDRYFEEKGYKVVRIPECEIRKDAEHATELALIAGGAS